jgi:type II secretory pathway pseudopilin PulG
MKRWLRPVILETGLFVVVLIVVASFFVEIPIGGERERIRSKATMAMLGTIQEAIKHYQKDHGGLPENLEGLQQGGVQSYLDPDRKLVDAWGRTFVYEPRPTDGREFRLCSKGQDGRFPSADDLDVRKLNGD